MLENFLSSNWKLVLEFQHDFLLYVSLIRNCGESNTSPKLACHIVVPTSSSNLQVLHPIFMSYLPK